MNDAGYGILGGVEETSAEEVEKKYVTNVFGLLNITLAEPPSIGDQTGFIG